MALATHLLRYRGTRRFQPLCDDHADEARRLLGKLHDSGLLSTAIVRPVRNLPMGCDPCQKEDVTCTQ